MKLEEHMDAISLPNVVLSETNRASFGSEKITVHDVLQEVIFKLANMKPLWVFEAIEVKKTYEPPGYKYYAVEFNVHQHGEVLGKLSLSYRGSTRTISVSNHRIDKERKRSTDYRTESADKAIAKAKKLFSPKNLKERIEAASEVIITVLGTQVWNRERAVNKISTNISASAAEFVCREDINPMFRAYLQSCNRTETLSMMDNLNTAKQDLAVIQSVTKSDNTTKVILMGNQYVVVEGAAGLESARVYTAETLPEWMRGKVGMLKLVPNETAVSDVGLRVSAEVFLLLNDAKVEEA